MKKFSIWITDDGNVGMGWIAETKNVRSIIHFNTIEEAQAWAKTYTGFADSEVRNKLDRFIHANEY